MAEILPELITTIDELEQRDRVPVECTPNARENLRRFNLAPASAPGKVAVTGSVIDLDSDLDRFVIMPDQAPEPLGIDVEGERVVGPESGITIGTDANVTPE